MIRAHRAVGRVDGLAQARLAQSGGAAHLKARQMSSVMQILPTSSAAVTNGCRLGSTITCEQSAGKWHQSAVRNALRYESVRGFAAPAVRCLPLPWMRSERNFRWCSCSPDPCASGEPLRSSSRRRRGELWGCDGSEVRFVCQSSLTKTATMYAVPGEKRKQSLRKILPWKPFRTLFLPSSWPAPLQHDPVSPARRLTCCPFA